MKTTLVTSLVLAVLGFTAPVQAADFICAIAQPKAGTADFTDNLFIGDVSVDDGQNLPIKDMDGNAIQVRGHMFRIELRGEMLNLIAGEFSPNSKDILFTFGSNQTTVGLVNLNKSYSFVCSPKPK